MCLDCGCKQVNEDHGDQRHITMDQLESAAQASNISTDEVVRNIQESAGAGSQGQQRAQTQGGEMGQGGSQSQGSGQQGQQGQRGQQGDEPQRMAS